MGVQGRSLVEASWMEIIRKGISSVEYHLLQKTDLSDSRG
jgi:hypothetical protein